MARFSFSPSNWRLTSAKAKKIALVFLCALLIAAAGGVGGYFIGYQKARQSPTGDPDLSLFWKAWDVINNNFYGSTSNTTARINGAISGMVASLGDPYTVYLAPADNSIFQSQIAGNFGGIGAELTVANSELVIQSVLSGTPAEKAGLKAQDVILKINGKSVSSLAFNDAINAIRGPKGSVVTLTVTRQGVNAPFDIKVTRDTITIKTVTTDTLGVNHNIAYIKVNEFGDDTTDAFQTALQNAVNAKSAGLIIDLRDNPGGLLDAAKAMIGMLLPENTSSTNANLQNRVAVLVRSKDGSEDKEVAGRTIIAPDLPTVVLVNGGSASASEIFSGALKDYKRATLVGTKTFGKGSVQDLIQLSNGGSIKVTIAHWFTPLGTGINGTGITPDITVSLPDSVTESTTDAQVQKALDLLPH